MAKMADMMMIIKPMMLVTRGRWEGIGREVEGGIGGGRDKKRGGRWEGRGSRREEGKREGAFGRWEQWEGGRWEGHGGKREVEGQEVISRQNPVAAPIH